jgi:hypothetical protein
MSVLAARPRNTVAALAVALAAVGVAVGSGANFTANSVSAANQFSSGTLSVSGPTSAILTATNLKPGESRTGIADIQNTGSISADFSVVSANVIGSGKLLDALVLDIKDCGTFVGATPPTCDGGDPVSTVQPNTVNVDLGTWQAADKHRYEFKVTLPSSVDNTYQGLSGQVDFRWNAVAG